MQQLMTLEEAAKVLNVKYGRAAQLARDRLIPIVKLGRHYRVNPTALETFIREGGKPLAGGWKREPEA